MYKFSEYDKKLGKKILTNKLWKKIISSTYRKNGCFVDLCFAIEKTLNCRLAMAHMLQRMFEKNLRTKRYVEGKLARKQRLKDEIISSTENNEFALNISSTDCDHYHSVSSFTYNSDMPLMEIFKRVEELYEYCEGPTNHWISKPSEKAQEYSRDYALEAFEDGHPHVIYR